MKKIRLKVKDIDIEWKDLIDIINELCIDDLVALSSMIAETVKARIIGVTEGWSDMKQYIELKPKDGE